ncbi:MAG: D-alanyl-D-alanine carboxypeptidase/D-alanyl-D-alanine endopeptidase [Gemmatimonadales bacterium]
MAVLAVFLLAPAPLGAQTVSPHLARQLDTWYRRAERSARGRWGIAIADALGNVLWSRQPDQPLIPASTAKIFTTGFARSRLGGDARIATRVLGTGFLDSSTGTWNGTWTLELNGDPSLEDPAHAGPRLYDLAVQLAAAGIRRIEGPMIVSSEAGPATATFPAEWPSRHRGAVFAPLIGTLTVHENIVTAWVAPTRQPGHRPRILDDAPVGVRAMIINEAITRTGKRSSLHLTPRRNGWVLTGAIGTRARMRQVKAVAYDPERVLELAWTQALRQAGVEWEPDPRTVLAPSDGRIRTLAEVFSPTLDTLAADIDRRSLNLGAELLLRWAAGPDSPADSLTAHVSRVTGVDPSQFRLVDGSGLSDIDRVTPRLQVTYLARIPTLPATRAFPLLLPANGTGTLTKLRLGLPGAGVLRAKTGTLGNVAAIAGYLGRPDGVFIISLIYNGGRIAAARQAESHLFKLLGARGKVTPDDFDVPADTTLEPTIDPTDTIGIPLAH